MMVVDRDDVAPHDVIDEAVAVAPAGDGIGPGRAGARARRPLMGDSDFTPRTVATEHYGTVGKRSASRARVMGQLFTEALVLTSVAAVIGLVASLVATNEKARPMSRGPWWRRRESNPGPKKPAMP